jgi:TrmH family RNA methyltransferase
VSAARRLLKPAARRAERRFLVEGPQAVREAAAAGLLLEVFATAAAAARHAFLAGLPVTEVAERTLGQLAETVTPQGLIGVARTVDVTLTEALQHRPGLIAVLVDARDPGNAGTIIRVADAAGAGAVIFASGAEGGSVDPHNGKCVRATAGSLFHVPVAVAPLEQTVAALRAAGVQLLAADGHATLNLYQADDRGLLAAPTAWLFGNEAHGLPAALVAAADHAVQVPIHGRAESLNLASAAAVCLYASARRQPRGRAAGRKGAP